MAATLTTQDDPIVVRALDRRYRQWIAAGALDGGAHSHDIPPMPEVVSLPGERSEKRHYRELVALAEMGAAAFARTLRVARKAHAERIAEEIAAATGASQPSSTREDR